MNKKYWEIKNTSKGIGEIYLYGDIVSSKWNDEDVTPKDIDKELKALGEMDILNIYINSGGGSVFAGMAIHNILKRTNAKVKNAYIDGLAASISSVIPLAADNVFIPINAMIMIHNPSSVAFGDSKEMRKMANTLDKVKESIVAVYVDKTKIEEKKIIKLMDNETWFTAKDAIDIGLADELQEEKSIVASLEKDFLIFNNEKVDINRYKNIPKIDILNINDKYEKEKFIEKEKIKIKQISDKIIYNQNKQYKQLQELKLKIMGGM